MIVRGWIILGTADTGAHMRLPTDRMVGIYTGSLPDAAACQPGDWIEWCPAPGALYAVAVCADMTLDGGLVSAEHQPDGIHTIPVPKGWTVEQAWEAIKRGDKLPEDAVAWANVRVEGGRFVGLVE